MIYSRERVSALALFIKERERIRENRLTGMQKPWTQDEILQQYRFCNIHREDDTVTRWIATYWRNPHKGEADNWFAMAVARWINWPDTLTRIGYPIPWRPDRVLQRLNTMQAGGAKVWTTAYLVSTHGSPSDNKAAFVVQDILEPLWQARKGIRPREGDTLQSFAGRLNSIKHQGSFMTGQIVADAKYDKHSPLWTASDWHTWAISGPGSRRGLNRVCGRDKNASWPEREWLEHLMILSAALEPMLRPYAIELHAQDLQNCLCEFDKYERARLGEGRPRNNYPGV